MGRVQVGLRGLSTFRFRELRRDSSIGSFDSPAGNPASTSAAATHGRLSRWPRAIRRCWSHASRPTRGPPEAHQRTAVTEPRVGGLTLAHPSAADVSAEVSLEAAPGGTRSRPPLPNS